MQRTMGIEVRFVDPSDPENFRRATDAKTRCYYAETLPNPKLEVFPIGEVAKIGREMGVPLIMDNTAAPVICRPLDHGAAVVMHSTTKYIGGHGTSIGGIVVDGGYGGLLGFELKGGKDAGRRFIDALQMFYHVANIGDARSLAIHPASTTHSQLTPEEQLQTGVTDGYVRLSLGIEHEDDIVADLQQALDKA